MGPTAVPDPEARETEPAGKSESEAAAATERLLLSLRAAATDLLELLRIRVDRARLGARRGLFRAVAYAWLTLTTSAATVIGVYVAILGVADALTVVLGGRPWAGRLAAGTLVLLGVAATIGIVRLRFRRAEVARLRARYGPIDSDRDEGSP